MGSAKNPQRLIMMARALLAPRDENGPPVALGASEQGELFIVQATGTGGLYVPVSLAASQHALNANTDGFPTASFLYGYNGGPYGAALSFDQLTVISDTNADDTIQRGVLNVNKPGQWRARVTAAEDVLATVTLAAPAAGRRHLVQGFEFSLSGAGNAPQDLTCRIRDGAGGTILWESYIFKDLGGQSVMVAVSDITLVLTAATAMVAEFSAAAGANTFQSINVRGITVD